MTPQEILHVLIAGNQRYIAGKSSSQNLPADREALAKGQTPIAAVIRCAEEKNNT